MVTTATTDKEDMTIIPSQFDMLGRMLDLGSLRHRVIAQNVANVNTPGYQRLDLAFEDAFVQRLVEGGGAGPGPGELPRVAPGNGAAPRADGNNVDIDAELGRLNKNVTLYNTCLQILANRIAAMRSALTGR